MGGVKDSLLAAQEALKTASLQLEDGFTEAAFRSSFMAAARIFELADSKRTYKQRLEVIDGRWYSLSRREPWSK